MSAPQPNPLAVIQLLLAKYHGETVAPLVARVAQLEQECASLRRQVERTHRGKYIPGALYEKGDEVCINGSSFRAVVGDPSAGPPGEGWVLVAAGRKHTR